LRLEDKVIPVNRLSEVGKAGEDLGGMNEVMGTSKLEKGLTEG
jgi:hypothetical protein